MIEEIITAISLRLQEVYPQVMVVTDGIEQGLEDKPCFLLTLLEPRRVPLVGQRWQQENLFDIQYLHFRAKNQQLYTIAEELFSELEYITLLDGGLLRGTGMRFAVQDGVLHFFVTYTVFLYEKDEKEKMEILTITEGLEGR